MSRLRRQMSYSASLSTWLVTSVCSRRECTHSTVVVRLDARRGDLRARPDRERDLRLLAVVDGEALEEQAAETGASAATAGVEDHEALKRRLD